MKINELRNIHTWVRNTEVSEIVFVSALILPVYLILYGLAFERIGLQSTSVGMTVALLIYAVGVVWMKTSQSRREKNQNDLTVITNHIVDQGFRFMSFDQISKIKSEFTEKRVRDLVFEFPNHLRLGVLRGKKPGIKVLILEEENSEN